MMEFFKQRWLRASLMGLGLFLIGVVCGYWLEQANLIGAGKRQAEDYLNNRYYHGIVHDIDKRAIELEVDLTSNPDSGSDEGRVLRFPLASKVVVYKRVYDTASLYDQEDYDRLQALEAVISTTTPRDDIFRQAQKDRVELSMAMDWKLSQKIQQLQENLGNLDSAATDYDQRQAAITQERDFLINKYKLQVADLSALSTKAAVYVTLDNKQINRIEILE